METTYFSPHRRASRSESLKTHASLARLSRVDHSPPPPPPLATFAPQASAPAGSSPVDTAGAAGMSEGRRNSGVKKHHHKHNLKHRYELLETLGRGTYGKVKKAIERHSGRVVAIKSIRKDKIKDEQDMVHIRREIEIMSALRHPHIISIYEGAYEETNLPLAFQTPSLSAVQSPCVISNVV